MCDNIKQAMNHTALARGVAKLAASRYAASVYIAAPPTLGGFMNAVKRSFMEFVASEGLHLDVYTADALKGFVMHNYKWVAS